MAGRTFAIGDIHGDMLHLHALLDRLPTLTDEDTVVFLGDYVDRGPDSAGIIQFVRDFHERTPARVVALRGNHEDAWLRVIDQGWPEFVYPPNNGCLACLRSFQPHQTNEKATSHEMALLLTGEFLPPDVVAWMRSLPFWYEDEHAIYVHAGLPRVNGEWLHPSEVEDPIVLLWLRKKEFFLDYRGKLVICGHTMTATLPHGISAYTPDDHTDLWAGEAVYVIDTGCGKGGFLTAVELPERLVYESRPLP